jgi:hypothetical protein
VRQKLLDHRKQRSRVKRNPLERQAILNAGVAAFFFTSASITSAEQVDAFGKAIGPIAKMISTQKRPFIARISKDGAVELWLNHKGEDLVARKRMK